MKKTRKNLKGTVLFTTVSVMALLILFLMGTLMLATASNGRAHKTYSSSQASYTARAAIDGFITAMERQPEVAVAVQQLGEGGEPIYPTVKIGEEGSLGRIVRIDEHGNEHFDEIVVENTGEKTYTFFDAKTNGVSKEAWHESDVVKITASARVGGEIETVSAYINKAPANYAATTPSGPQVKGLQVVGGTRTDSGSTIYGGYGVNLQDDPNLTVGEDGALQVYVLRNSAKVESSLTFINANFINTTSSLRIDVKKPADGCMPYSETVISGNMCIKNNTLAYLDYQPVESWTNNEIPYFYVNGAVVTLSTPDPAVKDLNKGNGNEGAFNFICGTLSTYTPYGNPESIKFDSTNVYLMDEYQKNQIYNVNWNENNPEDTTPVVMGDNFWGWQTDSTLSEWAKSLYEKTDMEAMSHTGGSIFCNGNLTTGGLTVDGDLRVKGDLKINTNSNAVHVKGNLFVGGEILGASSSKADGTALAPHHPNLIVDGYIYVPSSKATVKGTPTDVSTTDIPNEENKTVISDRTKYDDYIEVKMDDPAFQVKFMKWDTDLHKNDEGESVNPLGETFAEDISGVVYYRLNSSVKYSNELSNSIDDLNFVLSGDAKISVLEADTEGLFMQLRDNFDYANYYTPDIAAADEFIREYPGNGEGTDTICFVGKPINVGTREEPVFVPSVTEPTNEPFYCFFKDFEEGNNIMSETERLAAIDAMGEESIFNGTYTVKHIETGEVLEVCDSPYSYWYQINGVWTYKLDKAEVPKISVTDLPKGTEDYVDIACSGITEDEIYPPSMRREVIYGTPDVGLTEEGVPSAIMKSEDTEHQFIYNLFDARDNLGLGRSDGLPDLSVYLDDQGLEDMIDKAKAGITNTTYTSGIITQTFCELKDNYNSEIRVKTPKEAGDVTLLLNGATLNEPLIFEPAYPDQKLNIILKGKVTLESTYIRPVTVNEPIKYNDDFGITYLGFKNSKIVFNNQSYAFGSFKTPYTSAEQWTVTGDKFNYQPETWKAGDAYESLSPVIIGNAIFADVYSQQDFLLMYTQSGNGASSTSGTATVNTACGDFIVGYYGAS